MFFHSIPKVRSSENLVDPEKCVLKMSRLSQAEAVQTEENELCDVCPISVHRSPSFCSRQPRGDLDVALLKDEVWQARYLEDVRLDAKI